MTRTAPTRTKQARKNWRTASLVLCSLLSGCVLWPQRALAQNAPQVEVKVWEFSPYDVEVQYLFEADVNASPYAQQVWMSQVQAELERTFRAAWHVQLSPLRSDLAPTLLRHFDSFTIDDLKRHEERLANPTDATVATPADPNASAAANEQALASEPPPPARTNEKPAPSQNLWRGHDKLFFLLVRREGDETVVQVRELDGPLRFLGPAMSGASSNWNYAAHLAAVSISNAFAPVARVEDAESRSAQLRLRAGGLILHRDNPASVVAGDVMQPVVRRDDRNGVPTLLEPLPWTFAAITASDGVKLQANVYTYSGGPGLQGRKNRRTQRLLLKVRPLYEQSNLELVVRHSGQAQAGCFIYSRDMLTDQFELLGRTDWRGQLTIAAPAQPTEILPEAERAQRAIAKRAAAAQAMESQAMESPTPPSDAPAPTTTEIPTPEIVATENASTNSPTDSTQLVEQDTSLIPLRTPLLLLYVKQGDTVLAKLPMVPGLAEVETAELPDDRRRLLAEAFVRGFQGEILDVVGMRSLLAARVKKLMASNRREAATEAVKELRQLKNYTQMADELEAIQRRMLDETEGPIPLAAKSRIDVMFQTTRTMLQKYLQDSLLSDSERAVEGP